jgi:hypothetical protein
VEGAGDVQPADRTWTLNTEPCVWFQTYTGK